MVLGGGREQAGLRSKVPFDRRQQHELPARRSQHAGLSRSDEALVRRVDTDEDPVKDSPVRCRQLLASRSYG